MSIRRFIPGNEWLYLKVYTGFRTSDIILLQAIKPTVSKLKELSLISQWFFIRYTDPKSHIRIRFKLSDSENIHLVLRAINSSLQEFTDSGEVAKIIVDTYCQEIERYGYETIEIAEYIFYINSTFILENLHYSDEEKIIANIFSIERTLDELGLDRTEKFSWAGEFNQAFKLEFNADKKLNSQLNRKFLLFNEKYDQFLSSPDFLLEKMKIIENINSIQPCLKILTEKTTKEFLKSFCQSIFHMNINRSFTSNQRLFEMIIYDYLHRVYKIKIYNTN